MPLPKEIQKDVNELVRAIKRGDVIPIVGYDMLTSEFQQDAERDFLKILIKIHSEKNDNELEDILARTQRNEQELTGQDMINIYYHNLPNQKRRDNFKRALSETIQDERFNHNLTPESFRKLVSIKHFTFFINATFTNILTLAYNKFRARGKDGEEMQSSYEVTSDPTVISRPAPAARFTLKLEKPLIYNLFGTHDEAADDYLLTDADYVEFIHDLIRDKDVRFSNLVSFLNEADLLFLGCNFPDWFLRFFIRVCVGDRLDRVSPIERKTVIDTINNLQLDSSRSVFLGYYRIQTLKIDCNTLIDEIYQSLSNDRDKTQNILDDQGNNNVFISYCREDEQVVKDLTTQFNDKYVDYFQDVNNLRSGDSLNDKISTAIDKSCVFLFIVSSNIQKADKYLWEELRYAIARKKLVWPVYKEFVNKDMLLPPEFKVTDDLREVLNKNAKLGIVLSQEPASSTDPPNEEIGKGGYTIPEAKLREIKELQYLSRTGENKTP
jgi:hypothetical protein